MAEVKGKDNFDKMPQIGGTDIVPSGGTAGQVLTKDTVTDYDYSWQDSAGGGGDPSDLPAVTTRRTSQFSFGTTEVAIPFPTTDIENDISIIEHTSDTQITVKETGLYLIHASLIVDNNSDGKILTGRLFKNGTTPIPEFNFKVQPEQDFVSVTPARIISLTANDAIDLRVETSSNNGYIESGSTFGISRFMGLQGSTGAQGPSGSGSNIVVEDDDTPVTGTPHATLNFGDGLSATNDGGGQVTIASPSNVPQVVTDAIGQGTSSSAHNVNNTPTISTGTELASVTLTPGSASNKVQLTWNYICDAVNDAALQVYIFRGSTLVCVSSAGGVKRGFFMLASGSFIDSPATTSPVTYSLRFASSNGNCYWGQDKNGNDLNNNFTTGQHLTAMELSIG